MADRKHVRWFTDGARALRALYGESRYREVFPTDEDWYLCPLCLSGFTIEELDSERGLTAEHVPPRSLGGRELVLTCWQCNNVSGRTFDAEASKQQRFNRFVAGRSGQSERASYTIGDITTNVDVTLAGNSGVYIAGLPDHNDPANTQRTNEHMERLSESPSDFQFSVTPLLKFDRSLANVSWVRSAYLAAFALFGWRYVLRPGLEPIRDQFAHPTTVVIPSLLVTAPDGNPDRRAIGVIRQPSEWRSLIIVYGKQGVFLPLPDETRNLQEFATDLGLGSGRPIPSLEGSEYLWPQWPCHLADSEPRTE